MKKISFFFFLLFVTSFAAKAQFKGFQIMTSLEYVKFNMNTSDMINNQNPPLSKRSGVDAQWGLWRTMQLKTGVRLAQINQFRRNFFDCGVGVPEEMLRTGYIAKDWNIETILALRYYFKAKNRFQTYIEPFGSTNFNMSGDVFLEIGLASGIEYKLTNRHHLFAQPTYRHTFNDKSSWFRPQQIRNNFGLEMGIRFLRK